MSITYGKTTPTQYTDPEVVAIQIVADRIAAMLPVGNGWVDRFPFLRFLPIPEVMRLRRYHHEELLLFSSLRDAVRKRIVSSHIKLLIFFYKMVNRRTKNMFLPMS